VAKEIEDKIYTALDMPRDLVAPIERDEDVAPPMPDAEVPVAEAA
jgi:hypothetical protein